jgi:two-component system, chemotaxis family, chemotaxis protein CheY
MKGNSASILVVEDDPDIRELFKIILETRGYYVDLARDGLEAFERLRSGTRPSLILLDLMMPRMDGQQFLKAMRGTPFAKVPVVIMSGHHSAQKEAEKLNADGCLTKPVEFKVLLEMVGRFVSPRPGCDAA